MTRSLNFLNLSRSYDEIGHGVRFLGYDKTIEVSFFLEADALSKIHSRTVANKADLLFAFDVNFDQIREVAGNIYSKRRRASHIYSFVLTGSDF